MGQYPTLVTFNSRKTDMARRNHNSLKRIPHHTRRQEHIEPRTIYLLACEGVCTEPNYIKGLVTHLKSERIIAAGTEVIISPHNHTDPYGVLQDLLNTPNRENYDELWIVIDRDEVEAKGKGFGGHSEQNFTRAIRECKKNNVKVACSNPCFELWIVLHFEFRNTACTRSDIQKTAQEKINALLPAQKQLKSIADLKSISNLYDLLKDNTETAMKNAKKLEDNEAEHKNPSSGMFKLLNSMLGN